MFYYLGSALSKSYTHLARQIVQNKHQGLFKQYHMCISIKQKTMGTVTKRAALIFHLTFKLNLNLDTKADISEESCYVLWL